MIFNRNLITQTFLNQVLDSLFYFNPPLQPESWLGVGNESEHLQKVGWVERNETQHCFVICYSLFDNYPLSTVNWSLLTGHWSLVTGNW